MKYLTSTTSASTAYVFSPKERDKGAAGGLAKGAKPGGFRYRSGAMGGRNQPSVPRPRCRSRSPARSGRRPRQPAHGLAEITRFWAVAAGPVAARRPPVPAALSGTRAGKDARDGGQR